MTMLKTSATKFFWRRVLLAMTILVQLGDGKSAADAPAEECGAKLPKQPFVQGSPKNLTAEELLPRITEYMGTCDDNVFSLMKHNPEMSMQAIEICRDKLNEKKREERVAELVIKEAQESDCSDYDERLELHSDVCKLQSKVQKLDSRTKSNNYGGGGPQSGFSLNRFGKSIMNLVNRIRGKTEKENRGDGGIDRFKKQSPSREDACWYITYHAWDFYQYITKGADGKVEQLLHDIAVQAGYPDPNNQKSRSTSTSMFYFGKVTGAVKGVIRKFTFSPEKIMARHKELKKADYWYTVIKVCGTTNNNDETSNEPEEGQKKTGQTEMEKLLTPMQEKACKLLKDYNAKLLPWVMKPEDPEKLLEFVDTRIAGAMEKYEPLTLKSIRMNFRTRRISIWPFVRDLYGICKTIMQKNPSQMTSCYYFKKFYTNEKDAQKPNAGTMTKTAT